MKVSFATTCMNRLQHLKETLPANMRDNRPTHAVDVEFAVLDYGDTQGLEEWIKTDPMMVDAMESGFLRYGRNDAITEWNMSHAKNQAHRLATGDFLCNLDGDNFTGPQFAQYLGEIFRQDPNSVIDPSRRIKREIGGGLWGRVAIGRDNFMRLGGYDEKFTGWGGEEVDMIRRAKGMGLHNYFINDESRLRYIQHTDEERVANMFHSDAEREQELKKIWDINHGSGSRLINRARMIREIFHVMGRQVQVNDGEFGMGTLRVGLAETPLVLGPVDTEKYSRAHISAMHAPEFVIARLQPEKRNIVSIGGEGHEGEALIPRHA